MASSDRFRDHFSDHFNDRRAHFGRRIWAAAAIMCIQILTAIHAQAAEPDQVRQGELLHLLRHDCGSCHGMTLKGGLGRPLIPGRLTHLTANEISAIILDGVTDTPMPPWRGLLSETDARWLARQLKTGGSR